jgi:hypothetical protein
MDETKPLTLKELHDLQVKLSSLGSGIGRSVEFRIEEARTRSHHWNCESSRARERGATAHANECASKSLYWSRRLTCLRIRVANASRAQRGNVS